MMFANLSNGCNFKQPNFECSETEGSKWFIGNSGDLVLGGLHMIHERGTPDQVCGPIMPQGGLQAAEVMLYTVDRVNRAGSIMPAGVKLGAHILDDCDKDTYGLQQAVDFIKGNSLLNHFKVHSVAYAEVLIQST